jgi:glycosyltransferase involved in cell wall biosynthesis
MAAGRDGPFFSVLITAYNRAEELGRCVRSCVEQTFHDFEIVVVDDASTDATVDTLEALGEQRLRVVRHDRNRGISPSRATAVDHASGEWFVMLDSDWELMPGALDRLRARIDTLPPDVRIIRSRIQWDDGEVGPAAMPEGVTDYRGRLRWLEALASAGGSSDAGHCIHRSVFATTNYFADRRGAMETLWELNLARREKSLWVPDVLIRQYADSPNSHSRDTSASRLVPRLLSEAPDQLWMAETMLSEHGAELAAYAPHYRRWLLESASQEAFLSGRRRRGIRHARSALRAGANKPRISATVLFGILSPRVLATVKAEGRGWRARWQTMRHGGA